MKRKEGRGNNNKKNVGVGDFTCMFEAMNVGWRNIMLKNRRDSMLLVGIVIKDERSHVNKNVVVFVV